MNFTGPGVSFAAQQRLHFLRHNGATEDPGKGVSHLVLKLALEAADDLGGYEKLFDMRDGVVDDGLYLDGDELSYYPYYSAAHTVRLQPQAFYWLTLTRSPAGELVGYVDGAEQFRVADADGRSSAISSSGMVTFFHDDNDTSGEHFAGVVTRIRLFDSVLTPAQVAALTGLDIQVVAVLANQA